MVTHDEVKKIAALAKLYIAENELDAITADLNSVIEFADAVSKIDASGIDADASATRHDGLRPDEVSKSLDRELILKNAMEAGEGCFVVRERGEKGE